MSKLGLGTVQIGMDYGISNKDGQTTFEEVVKILGYARNSGVRILDTAQGYGNAESILGKAGVDDFDVVTKMSKEGAIETSLENLQLDSVYAVLAHNADDLINSNMLWDKFQEYKRNGLVEKAGVSVYDAEQIDAVLEKYDIDIIQLPINIYDQRLIQSGHLKELKIRGVEIHVRSAFLQGLLLMDVDELPAKFTSIKKHHAKYLHFLEKNEMTKIEACLGFLYGIKEIDRIVCGVSNCKQFIEIFNLDSKIDSNEFLEFSITNKRIVNPANWI